MESISIDAAREFLNHYGIPFSPLEYFGYEVSNEAIRFIASISGNDVTFGIVRFKVVEYGMQSSNRYLKAAKDI